jgi:hypothetical protein
VQHYYDKKYRGIYRIILMTNDNTQKVIWAAPFGQQREHDIILWHHDKHYDVVIDPGHLFYNKQTKICYDCKQAYHDPLFHRKRCPAKCSLCCRIGKGPCPKKQQTYIECRDCARVFYNIECYHAHQGRVCKELHSCTKCRHVHRTSKKEHICNTFYCEKCRKYHRGRNECYMQTDDLQDKIRRAKIMRVIAYDFETTQDKVRVITYDFDTTQVKVIRAGIKEQEVNFVSVRWTCTFCADRGATGEESTCSICRTNYQKDDNDESPFQRKATWNMYNCMDPLESFVKWILTAFDNRYETLAYAHNGGRFDGHFVLRQLYKMKLAPKLRMAGTKIFEMEIKTPNYRKEKFSNIKFR